MHDLDQNEQIEQKDQTLLEHLSKRLRYKRGGKHGAIQGIMLDVQDLLVDKLGRQDYTLVADILHLACFEKAAAGRNRDKVTFCVGINAHILEVSSYPSDHRPLPPLLKLLMLAHCAHRLLCLTGQSRGDVRRRSGVFHG